MTPGSRLPSLLESLALSRTFDAQPDMELALAQELLSRASLALATGRPADLDATHQEVLQGLLLAADPAQGDLKQRFQRLVGDIDYWRARSEIDTAVSTLDGAVKHLESSIQNRPRYHRRNAGSWLGHTVRMRKLLRDGPKRVAPGSVADSPQTTAVPPIVLPFPDLQPNPEQPQTQAPPGPAPTAPTADPPRGGILL